MERVDVSRRTSSALRALSHEQRLLILSHLTAAERSVGELERMLELGQPAVSQQLARLRQDRLVVARREGRVIYYRASREHVETLLTDLASLLGSPCPCRERHDRMAERQADDDLDDADQDPRSVA
ncbi:ArsR/SmtB family transcription factor [Oharaeibacter diazotrophicus]|uniref:DNA-binding transcriptional ArsR family regulator n=1 Tax=Oharaeibacter diazotrophicus TaxID=1920512 RepID=A0A4R6RJV6_9HYPH|nr:DNA-binding transcriptional ArsR family regulator [Oharaeibacter diazotrophicus]GLS78636.1 transcriptional regulator [Oharaeibacter diazotrophicus]